MNRLIGITGGMASGKTTLAYKILLANPDYVYFDVDVFRRNLFFNQSYIKELKKAIPELTSYSEIDSTILNKYIYRNPYYMKAYKDILYRYLFDYLNSFNNKTILVDWALILNDNLQDKFDKIIYLDVSEETRLARLKNSDLPIEEILKRFKLQRLENLDNYNNLLIVDNDTPMIKINDFINQMECKFTLPNNESKAIWEITHQCNYICSYCIFSCNNSKIVGELTTQECFHVIDELVKNGFKHLKITGGEPFIRKDIIDILKYASTRLTTDISTNASLITDKTVALLNELKLKMIHVSLDGNKIEHELVRGKDTYERTIRGLKALRKSLNKVRIGSVINLNNENNLENLIIDSIELEADEIIFSIMEPVSGQDLSYIKTKSDKKLIEQLEELKQKYHKDIIVNYNFGKQPNYVHYCPAGDKFIYINNLGQISPCTWILEKDKTCLSRKSLKDHSLEELLKDKTLVKFLENKCEGRCYGQIR